MSFSVVYLTHPQVVIDPGREVRTWGLSATGAARVRALALRPGSLSRVRRVVASDEVKAVETAAPLAAALRVRMEVREGMRENDRSSTGFLPPEEFERIADRFFARPDESVRGWETARAAQSRILGEVADCLDGHAGGDVLLVGHGGVGTLLYCALAGVGIDRRYDQAPGGGGNWFRFDGATRAAVQGWRPMEALGAAP